MKRPIVRMCYGAFGSCAAVFNLWQACLVGFQPGKIIWGLAYVAWMAMFAWGLHDWLLAKLKKN